MNQKKNSLKIFSVVFLAFFSIIFLNNSFANECLLDVDIEDKSTLRKAIEICEKQIKETEKDLQKAQASRTNTERDIQVIEYEIQKAILDINRSSEIINELKGEIYNKEAGIEEIKRDIKEKEKFLINILQQINEEERRGFLTFIFSGLNLSSFIVKVNNHDTVRESLENSIDEVDFLQRRLAARVQDLSSKQEEQAKIKVEKEVRAGEVKDQKDKKQELLNFKKELESTLEDSVEIRQRKISEIRNRLFEFAGGGPIPFEQAVQIAKEAEDITGIRPEFLLGLIKHESNLGKNIGTAYWYDDMHPTRDVEIFKALAEISGFDPDDVKVSAAVRNSNGVKFGWGGAMGPAQFIPSTWVCFGGLINSETNRCSRTNFITKELSIGSTGSIVKKLQVFLNSQDFLVAKSGPGSKGKETTTYGSAVASAVTKFQEYFKERILIPNGLSSGNGRVGPSTKNALNEFSFALGPWKYVKKEDRIRNVLRLDRPSNPFTPRDALIASSLFLTDLGANNDECVAARRYYAGGNWRSNVALSYCRAVLGNAASIKSDIEFIGE